MTSSSRLFGIQEYNQSVIESLQKATLTKVYR